MDALVNRTLCTVNAFLTMLTALLSLCDPPDSASERAGPNRVPEMQRALQNDARFIHQKMPRAKLYMRAFAASRRSLEEVLRSVNAFACCRRIHDPLLRRTGRCTLRCHEHVSRNTWDLLSKEAGV